MSDGSPFSPQPSSRTVVEKPATTNREDTPAKSVSAESGLWRFDAEQNHWPFRLGDNRAMVFPSFPFQPGSCVKVVADNVPRRQPQRDQSNDPKYRMLRHGFGV